MLRRCSRGCSGSNLGNDCLPSAEQSSSDAPLAPALRTTDSSTQTSQSALAAHAQGQVTLRRGGRSGAPRRPRPSSMVDYQSYRHTQQLVRKILEQPAAQGLAPEVQELVESIRNVLESDQEHMEEAVRCASYIEQVGGWCLKIGRVQISAACSSCRLGST